MFRASADIGGTFTDLVVVASSGECFTKKVLSTPDDYARAIVEGLGAILSSHNLAAADCEELVHGTTVATNAILEYKGARTALLTTKGFRDVLELRRLRVPTLFDLKFRPPEPLVPRRLRFELAERMTAEGLVHQPLQADDVLAVVSRLRQAGVGALAVSLLHSYRNDAHEAKIAEVARRELPEVFLSVSSELLPEMREYERTSTTVINAYVGPVVRDYLASLEQSLAKLHIDGRLKVMESSGGVMSAAAASRAPAHIVESGPAAGVIAGQVLSRQADRMNVITFDMGGTSAKASLIEDGEVSVTTEYEVGAGVSLSSRLVKGGGHALKLPVLDIAEVGAGGGSIVWVDKGGALKVGPRSAGADPGPACYGRGGSEPTVTDANVVLGYLNPNYLAGGEFALVPSRAQEVFSKLAKRLGTGLEEAAYGVFSVVNANMMRAIKAVTTYRGRDPRKFTLLAFGGNGPVHAAALARELGITHVIIPPAPGVFSAVGLIQANPEHRFVQSFVRRHDGLSNTEVLEGFRELEQRAHSVLEADGYPPNLVTLRRQADLRYIGQSYELAVAAEGADPNAVAERFGSEHERVYGHRAQSEPIEWVNLRVTATVDSNGLTRIRANHPARSRQERQVFMEGRLNLVPVLSRADLAQPHTGPLVVEDYDATTVVPWNATAQLDETGSIVMDLR